MAKKSKREIAARRLMVLEEIYKQADGIKVFALTDVVAQEFEAAEKTVLHDLEELKSEGFPIEIDGNRVWVPAVGMKDAWKKSNMGVRLAKSERKTKLALATYSFIKDHKDVISNIIAGTGTTVRECVHELLDRESELEQMRVYTANLLVLHDFIYHAPAKLRVELANGELDLDRAALAGKTLVAYLKGLKDVEAIITSFSDMSFEKGFCTEFQDTDSKMANLRPDSPKCRWVIIPIEWRKIWRSVNTPVAGSRDEQVDFAGGKRKYVIITDKPSPEDWEPEVDDPKLEDLEKWKTKYGDGVEIVYA